MDNITSFLNINLISFNCYGILNKLDYINLLCKNFDIIFLQETWLNIFNLPILHDINNNFFGYGLSSINNDILNKGRPFGGTAILYKKSLSKFIKIIDSSD